jgi:hypothetical protein
VSCTVQSERKRLEKEQERLKREIIEYKITMLVEMEEAE